jgi:hypothetical protein
VTGKAAPEEVMQLEAARLGTTVLIATILAGLRRKMGLSPSLEATVGPRESCSDRPEAADAG